ncbi:Cytochrome c-552 [Vibrio mangrovi]|uniref:Cytochrome c n=2 Tax=Vibrio mangrovi TaxID=474394 RepID=A0A1Y6IWE2_9VIBR|nr:cytochrome c [Vibrio mangrovi]MDW6001610.1 cytochrome c [Vibrio mangrovi]SMS00363.1 Cytochrome c-552 [Vibrio mangrovi]
MKKRFLLGLVTSLLSLSVFAGEGDIVAGKKKSMICAGCHGIDGIAQVPGFPSLRGKNEQYFINAMKAYQAQRRTGGSAAMMSAQANALSEQDIKDLAAYYANMK